MFVLLFIIIIKINFYNYTIKFVTLSIIIIYNIINYDYTIQYNNKIINNNINIFK